MKGNVRFVSHL